MREEIGAALDALDDPLFHGWQADPRVVKIVTQARTAIVDLNARAEKAEEQCDRAVLGLNAVKDLISASDGVAGLHVNGDVAPWAELRTGGQFGMWLEAFDGALVDDPPAEEDGE